MRTLVLLAAACLVAADRTPAPLPADKAAAGMVLPDGFRATVFAAEPLVTQPISFCLDHRGRAWVAEALNYGAWQPTGKDRVAILEDTDGDGRADRRTVFYEGFNYVTGIEVGFGGVWVMSPPCLYFVPDRDGDDRPDGPPEVVFDGFGYKESRHNLANGFTWGPDGWLYAGHGRTSPSDVGPPGTPAEKRVHCDGGVVRVHPTRRVFEPVADGTTNPWGVDFDDFGQCFVSNCVTPHLFHVIPGGHYEPWRNRPSSLYAYERLPTIADHLHYPTGRPGEMRGESAEAQSLGGGHAHCGTLVYLGDAFPPQYRNTVLMCNVHGRRINNDVLRRAGSGYAAGHGKDFMLSPDPWFMGVTLRTGPDGGVLVSDWSDTGECHTYTPDRATGRIYSIRYGDRRPPVDLARLPDAELVKLQGHRNEWHVRHARRALQERYATPGWDPEPTRAALRAVLANEADVPRRLRAMWALYAVGGLDRAGLVKLLDDRSEHVRGGAVRLIVNDTPPESMSKGWTEGAEAVTKFARMAAADPSPVVRLELASALQRLPFGDRWAIAEGLLSHSADASDANLPLMIWYGVEPLVPVDQPRAMGLAASAAIPKVRQFIARRLVDDAAVKGESGDLGPLVDAIGKAPDAAVQRDLLAGAREAVRGRKRLPTPEAWEVVYPRLTKSPDPAVRDAARVLALVFGDRRAVSDLRAIASDVTTRPAERTAAVQTLVEARVPDLAPFLHSLVAEPAVRSAALRGLAAYPHPDTAAKVLAVYPALTADERADAVATLAARRDSALALLDAVEAKAVPRGDLSAYAARQMHALGDRAVSDRLRQVWGEVREADPDKKKVLARYTRTFPASAVQGADRANGRRVFARSCGQCHKLFGEGGSIGPDLSGSNRSDLGYLLANLADPSAEVAKDFRMSVVRTADGRTVTGILVERTAARLVVQTATERVTLPAEDVEGVSESRQSIMPEGLLDALAPADARDLLAYLGSKTQVSLPPGAGR
jgi:putative membrane-bound dehydrogenase-like protein